MFSFISQLESRIASRAESLEEVHLCAAIDAQLTNVLPSKTNVNPSTIVTHGKDEDSTKNEREVIFDDYINPNSVQNCFSPFVPTSSDRIQAFIELTQLKPQDNVLDLGCGDGRVCIAVTKTIGCRAIGVDVSPPCIAMARNVAQEENICETKCAFFEADATVNPDILLSGKPVSNITLVILRERRFYFPRLCMCFAA